MQPWAASSLISTCLSMGSPRWSPLGCLVPHLHVLLPGWLGLRMGAACCRGNSCCLKILWCNANGWDSITNVLPGFCHTKSSLSYLPFFFDLDDPQIIFLYLCIANNSTYYYTLIVPNLNDYPKAGLAHLYSFHCCCFIMLQHSSAIVFQHCTILLTSP